ncbi:hypothetical protein LTR56_020402 [Elasticomyces elasticus]|nr:hypothetical protein LTR56_020402 [Elasticomyces elasticus]KAK3633126.1 hypothetical protein LTR22_020324 [Elasticomyces elasticus]KAK4910260.1 hypothetical protein LTR49_021077 [Elasticomyces elasticus]KAK5750013.1 hypothetical protein LTS12_019961 [Elasticomyces elasticus]
MDNKLHSSNSNYSTIQPEHDLPDYPPPPYEDVAESSSTARSRHVEDTGQRHHTPSPASSDEELLEQALEFTHHQVHSPLNESKLPCLVAIPHLPGAGRLLSPVGLPFTRAYAPLLGHHNISEQDFLEFIDNLNIVSASSPPLQVLDLAGGILGFVPLAHSQIISGILQAGAQIGNRILSRTRGDVFLEKSNTDFFKPRSLKVELVTGKALKLRLRLRPDTSLVAATSLEGGDEAPRTLTERKLDSLASLIARLVLDVPPPNEPTNVLNQTCARQQAKHAHKADERWLKHQEKSISKSPVTQDTKSDKARREIRKLDREYEKLERKREEELEKASRKKKSEREANKVERHFEKDVKQLEKDYREVLEKQGQSSDERAAKSGRREEKEAQWAEKAVWLVVENLY